MLVGDEANRRLRGQQLAARRRDERAEKRTRGREGLVLRIADDVLHRGGGGRRGRLGDGRGAYERVLAGRSRLYAVWPGQWSSDHFVIDDLDEYARAVGIVHDEEREIATR